MKRSIKIAVAAAIALSSTSAFATNGDHLIGMGAKARGMGGIGIGMSHGAESALVNPALITSVNGTEVSFGGTIFMPDVRTDLGTGEGSYDSAANLSVIPEVAIAQKASDNFYWGIGMFGVAGMGTDYRDANTAGMAYNNFHMVTNLQLMQFAVPLAYKSNGFSLGVAPVLQYGSLDINYDGSSTKGVAQDFGFGYNVGAAYEMSGLTVGASYKSAIDMSYTGQISAAMADFTGMMGFPNPGIADNLEQPAEIGIGASYKMGGSTFAVDYKQIKWSDAKGYKEFGWNDQNVIILGYQYTQDNWALRAGYNHAASPIKDQMMTNPLANTFNLLGFPATVENHYTVGGSLAFNKMTSVDLAYMYAPEVSDTYSSALPDGMGGFYMGNVTTKHSQQGVTAQLNFNF
ncbi:OmpP1/FadL family transporter [Sulfuricurvum sp.]|uniref:OmpP1/FadL family transporter n=1 Tax=Sulfuricurvum sp. TaxID=2025608 RepID=UPI002D444F5F|nr:outer membrane protein transport protein [Sulfuricurvum sp.]HZF71729.1 outer membrane protein transport protein [Sulfuricurvum sp.]